MMDQLITGIDRALRAITAVPSATVALAPPLGAASESAGTASANTPVLAPEARTQAAALMRVNHVGEVCAQALYHGQALTARTPEIRAHMERAAVEEGGHLALCAGRIGELGGRVSWLNPLWYVGSFALGVAAGRAGDAVSLGFVAETERQVEAHLESHLATLPAEDVRSRAIVMRMRDDEARHRNEATAAGGAKLPLPARLMMKAMAKVMTTVAYRL
jgi:3-demethoxyubiquinol 3-hydroxylase